MLTEDDDDESDDESDDDSVARNTNMGRNGDDAEEDEEANPTTTQSEDGNNSDIIMDALRKVLTEAAAVNLGCDTGGDYHYARNFKAFEDVVDDARVKITNMLDACVRSAAGVSGGDGGGENHDDADAECSVDAAREDAEERFERMRDAVDARCDAIDAAVMIARGDNARCVVTSTSAMGMTATAGGEKGGRGRRSDGRLDASATRPQEQFEDEVDNARDNREHKGLMRPIGYESYEAYAEALRKRVSFPDFIQAPRRATLPTPLDEENELSVVSTVEELEALAQVLDECKEFAVDLEHHSYRSFKGFTCLMQISTREKDFVVDTLTLRSHLRDALGKVFADENILKVMHGADNDVQWLQKDFGMFIACLFDTGQAARVLELPSKGLAYLLHHYCGVKANKKFQLADWRMRPLTKEMVEYARGDTHHLLYVFDRLKEALHAQGPDCIAETLSRSRDVCLKRYEPPSFDEGAYYEDLVKTDNLKELSDPQLAVYAALFGWRDSTARDADESIGYVMPRGLMLRLSTTTPSTTRALLAECRGEAPLVAKHATHVVDLIARAHALGAPSYKPVRAPQDAQTTANTARPGVVAVGASDASTELVKENDGDDGKALEPLEPIIRAKKTTTTTTKPDPAAKRKRGGSLASLMSGGKKKSTTKKMISSAEIFGSWGADAAPAPTVEPVNAPAKKEITTVKDADAADVPGSSHRGTIELPELGISVPAPFRPSDKNRPFIVPMDREQEAADARAELARRREEKMRGYDSSDSDEDVEAAEREEMEAMAKEFDSTDQRRKITEMAKKEFGISGFDILHEPAEPKKEKRGFNERFKNVYEEPFKAGPKSRVFPRGGNRFTTFKDGE